MKPLVITQKVDDDDDIMGFFHNWLEKLAPLVDELFVLTLYTGRVHLPPNVKVWSLGKERGAPRALWAPRFYGRLVRLWPQVSAVFCHMCPEYVLAVTPLNLISRRPTLFWYAHVAVNPLAARALKHVDRLLTPSPESFTLSTEKLVCTGHGIDVDRFRPGPARAPSDRLEILNVNRISRVKNVDTLVEAARILRFELDFPRFRVRVVGAPVRPEDTAYWEHLRQKTRDYGVEEQLEWLGPVANRETVRFYQESDVFVRMQGGGGYGKNELEALACGLPTVICSPVYEPVLGPFRDSLVFPERDPRALAERIVRVSRWTPAERARYRDLVRGYVVRTHNLDTLVRRLVDEMQALARSDPSRRETDP